MARWTMLLLLLQVLALSASVAVALQLQVPLFNIPGRDTGITSVANQAVIHPSTKFRFSSSTMDAQKPRDIAVSFEPRASRTSMPQVAVSPPPPSQHELSEYEKQLQQFSL